MSEQSVAKTPYPDRRSAEADRLSPVAALVRRHDRDRFQTALFAPAARREALFALYAFNYEIARVRESVTQPTLGRIRLEWWRENVAAAYENGPVRQNPVVEALAAAIRHHRLTRAHFDRLIDAREADFEEEPPANLAALEAYAEGTSATLIYLALEVLGSRESRPQEAGRHIGIAYALSGLLRALPLRIALGRPVIPVEVAARHGLGLVHAGTIRGSAALRAAVGDIAMAAGAHLRAARDVRGAVARTALPALLPAAIADRALRRLKRAGWDPFDPGLSRPDPLQSWRLAAAILRNRY
jgi:NADH dehydrogenase [ubiquinone] 1 alpha subcomplex assembly factor 6